jgi:hypothetical protein
MIPPETICITVSVGRSLPRNALEDQEMIFTGFVNRIANML